MPQPYEILNARVKQKIDTEAGWLAVEDDLGVILQGEQAFVTQDDGTPVNFKIGDGTKKFSELPYFIAYYSNVISHKTLFFIDYNTDIIVTSTFRNFSCLYDVILLNNSGSDITLKAGTNEGANDLFEIIVGQGANSINVRKVFSEVSTLYLSGLAGKSFSLVLIYFQYDENPVTPPSGGGSTYTFRWPKNTMGMYSPLSDTDLNSHWNFTTGRGVAGTVWENCAISGTNGTESMGRFYPVGWQAGDNLRPATTFGVSSGQIVLSKPNLPSGLRPKIWGTEQGKPGAGGGVKGRWVTTDGAGNNTGDGYYLSDDLGGTSTPIDIRPKSKVVLYWVAIED